MKRVMIVGGPGSGKSTLARALGARTGLPVYHMDLLHWKENWEERPGPEKIPMARAIEAKENWIFEGGISSTYQNRLSRADMLIWLDLPVWLRLWRVTKRLFRYLGRNRPDLPRGCTERLHPETLRFYKFIWAYRHIQRDKIARLLAAYDGSARIVHLKRPREVSAFLSSMPANAQ